MKKIILGVIIGSLSTIVVFAIMQDIRLEYPSILSKQTNKQGINGLTTAQSDEEFIRAQYLQVLKREPDPNGLKYYLVKLKSSEWTRDHVISHMKNSDEYKRLLKKTPQ
jgi:hypothetical protein